MYSCRLFNAETIRNFVRDNKGNTHRNMESEFYRITANEAITTIAIITNWAICNFWIIIWSWLFMRISRESHHVQSKNDHNRELPYRHFRKCAYIFYQRLLQQKTSQTKQRNTRRWFAHAFGNFTLWKVQKLLLDFHWIELLNRLKFLQKPAEYL